jgi:cephalosporin hydroxylase
MDLQRSLRRVKRWVRARRRSALPLPLLETIQRGTLQYTFKGVPTLKDPFDLALYQMLLWEARPASLIELGSHQGGSALWLAAILRALDVPCHIHSVDLTAATLAIPGVTFYAGDARDLAKTFPADLMRGLARPLMVIEDADHRAETTLAVLRFFDQWLAPGEYIIVEDGIVGDMGTARHFGGGPCVAIERFLAEAGARYEIDRRYCDWYGRNVTANVNGYIRRKA